MTPYMSCSLNGPVAKLHVRGREERVIIDGAAKGGEASGQRDQRDASGALAEDDESVDDRHQARVAGSETQKLWSGLTMVVGALPSHAPPSRALQEAAALRACHPPHEELVEAGEEKPAAHGLRERTKIPPTCAIHRYSLHPSNVMGLPPCPWDPDSSLTVMNVDAINCLGRVHTTRQGPVRSDWVC